MSLFEYFTFLPLRTQRWVLGTFTFGAGRTMMGEYPEHTLWVQRVPYSVAYGAICINPFFAAWEGFKLVNRVEIRLKGTDPKPHSYAYDCGWMCKNPRLIW